MGMLIAPVEDGDLRVDYIYKLGGPPGVWACRSGRGVHLV